jgi:D-alanine-D-alanine ligase
VGILFGGRSAEHEVSVVSAQGVMGAIDRERFQVVPLGITKDGAWLTPEETQDALAAVNAERLAGLKGPTEAGGIRPQVLAVLDELDVVFPLVHGTFGEDGSLQGFLEILDVAYVGAGVAGSAVGMDKALQQMIFRQAGLPVPRSLVVTESRWQDEGPAQARDVEAKVGYPCFVKPANSGSSIGTSKVRSREDLADAMTEAFRFDRKALIEQAIDGRQVECAVLGNDHPKASPLGEIVFTREFYDYVAKYEDSTTKLIIPAELSPDETSVLQAMAIDAFQAIDCAGMGRVDFFLGANGQPYLNEVNTIPGFTPVSMYPKLWEAAGLSYRDLITKLIELGLERYEEKQRRV